jgi:hypothetical protein
MLAFKSSTTTFLLLTYITACLADGPSCIETDLDLDGVCVPTATGSCDGYLLSNICADKVLIIFVFINLIQESSCCIVVGCAVAGAIIPSGTTTRCLALNDSRCLKVLAGPGDICGRQGNLCVR